MAVCGHEDLPNLGVIGNSDVGESEESDARTPNTDGDVIRPLNSDTAVQERALELNPLWPSLKRNFLTGPNFRDWLRNLKLNLIMENLAYILEQKRPDPPPENAPDTSKQAYQKWVRDNNRVRAYMMGSMSNDIWCIHEKLDDAESILLHLEELYGWHDRIARDEIRRKLFNYTMKEGSDVGDHCIKMSNWFDRLKGLGETMDSTLLTDLILHSLPESFSFYVESFYITKFDSFVKLRSTLVFIQAHIRADGREPKKRRSKKHKRKVGGGCMGVIAKTNKAYQVGEKRVGKCLFCNETGHWKRECPKFEARNILTSGSKK